MPLFAQFIRSEDRTHFSRACPQMADILFLVLLIAHVIFVVAWMGGAILFVSVISPATRKMSESSRIDFIQSAIPRYVRFVSGASISAIVVGLLLYVYSVQISPLLGPSSAGLIEIQIGAILGIIALILVFGVVAPAARKLVHMAKGSSVKSGPDNTIGASTTSEMARLQNRMRAGSGLGVGLLFLALILMLVGAAI